MSARGQGTTVRQLRVVLESMPPMLAGIVHDVAVSIPGAVVTEAVAPEDFLRDTELAALRMPVRIVWGERDRLLPAGTLPFFRAHLPRAEVVTLPHAGHLPHLEAPTELARAIALPLGGP